MIFFFYRFYEIKKMVIYSFPKSFIFSGDKAALTTMKDSHCSYDAVQAKTDI